MLRHGIGRHSDIGRQSGRRGTVLACGIACAVLLGVAAPQAAAAPVPGPPRAGPASVAAVSTATASPTRAPSATPARTEPAVHQGVARQGAAYEPAANTSATNKSAANKSAAPSRPVTLKPGSSGRAVRVLQHSLARLGYFVPRRDGRYDHGTTQAVTALQKTAGLTRSGVYDARTAAALDRGVTPAPRTRGTERLVEIDLDRQLLLLVKDGRVVTVVNTSTGLMPAFATPRGRFRVFRQVDRWHQAPLGELYRPKFFHRGYAIHGVRDGLIPAVPASHGCARVSTAAMDRLWARDGLRMRDRVWVY